LPVTLNSPVGHNNNRAVGVMEKCYGCNRDVSRITKHINKAHNRDGNCPKTTAELNIAEGGIINRWITCPVEGCETICEGNNGLMIHSKVHRVQLPQQQGQDHMSSSSSSSSLPVTLTVPSNSRSINMKCRVQVRPLCNEHGKNIMYCTPCGGSALCTDHGINRKKHEYLPCNHGRKKGTCKKCDISGFCKHGRKKNICKECGGRGLCEHGRIKAYCLSLGKNALISASSNKIADRESKRK
jgi:hypothetical protein